MTTAAVALTLGIISAIAVICIFAMLIVGAASDPLSQFDSPDESQDKRTVREQREGQGTVHTHFESADR